VACVRNADFTRPAVAWLDAAVPAAACPVPQGDGYQGVDEGNVVDILAGLPTDPLPLHDDY
jgi:hypothetical protein